MQMTRSKIRDLRRTVFIAVWALAWVLGWACVTTAGTYTDSAHGDSSDGVNRLGTGYPVGSCSHCHDPCRFPH